jgi:hypothetical protein
VRPDSTSPYDEEAALERQIVRVTRRLESVKARLRRPGRVVPRGFAEGLMVGIFVFFAGFAWLGYEIGHVINAATM